MIGSSRPAAVIATLVATLLMGACGSGDGGDDTGSAATVQVGTDSSTPAAAAGEEPADAGAVAGEADCTVLTSEVVDAYILGSSLLGQIVGPAQVSSLRDGGLGYEPDAMAEALAQFHVALDGRPAPGQNDPKAALAFFEDLNERAGALLALPDPVSQDVIDEYVAASGGFEGTVPHQVTINSALEEYCPGVI